MDPASVLADLLPILTPGHTLEQVPETIDENTGEVLGGWFGEANESFVTTLRWTQWLVEDGQRVAWRAHEDRLRLIFAEHRGDPRVDAYLAGWVAAVRLVFARDDEARAAGSPRPLEYATLDLLVAPDTLALRRPKSADDFTDALLSSPRRLGRLLT